MSELWIGSFFLGAFAVGTLESAYWRRYIDEQVHKRILRRAERISAAGGHEKAAPRAARRNGNAFRNFISSIGGFVCWWNYDGDI
ncbi:hypothetical protein [Allofournierella sp.]|uniref:hypothetical protein n=1 Tax=Allofournierella sp. TaxID=1940256 RepID=UPI003AF115E8